jgi:formylglycine-generating enzyme required for sulfatase activity
MLPGEVPVKLRQIPGGTFWMGSRDGYHDEMPRQLVHIPTSYFLGETPITVRQYKAFQPDFRNFLAFENPDHPAVGISWLDAHRFCRWLTTIIKSSTRIDQAWQAYFATLPSEAEWEYACRGSAVPEQVEQEYWNGDGETALMEVGWFEGNSGGDVQCVGGKLPNPWGLHDMHGLIWEWCRTEYKVDSYSNQRVEELDASGRNADLAQMDCGVLRGGSWLMSPHFCRSSTRYKQWNTWRDYGFRIALKRPNVDSH